MRKLLLPVLAFALLSCNQPPVLRPAGDDPCPDCRVPLPVAQAPDARAPSDPKPPFLPPVTVEAWKTVGCYAHTTTAPLRVRNDACALLVVRFDDVEMQPTPTGQIVTFETARSALVTTDDVTWRRVTLDDPGLGPLGSAR